MTISILLAQQIAQLFLMILMGFLIVKAGLLKDEDSKVLSKIVLYLIIPCVILNAFQVDYTPETVRGLLVAFAASLLMQVVLLFAVSALGRVFHLDAVEITSVYYSNSGNLIVPLVTAVLGAEWVLYSCVYMSVQLVFFWTHCKKVISREASYDWKKIVLNLNIISIFVGILLFSRASGFLRWSTIRFILSEAWLALPVCLLRVCFLPAWTSGRFLRINGFTS